MRRPGTHALIEVAAAEDQQPVETFGAGQFGVAVRGAGRDVVIAAVAEISGDPGQITQPRRR